MCPESCELGGEECIAWLKTLERRKSPAVKTKFSALLIKMSTR